MAFPVSPTNGQTAVVNNITYQFSNVGNTWTRILSTANVITANIITANTLNINTLISVTGNVSGNYILGNGALLTGVITSVANINNGTSNVTVVSSGGNVTVGVGGTSNVAVFATTGEYITGLLSASGNITGSNLLTTGAISATGTLSVTGNTTLSTVSTGNISAGNVITGGVVSATANITGGNVLTAGLISSTGTITGSSLLGSVVSVTANVTGGNLLSGGLASVSGNITGGNLLTGGLISATGNIIGGNVNTSALRPLSGGLTVSTVSGNLNLSPTSGNIVVNSTYINGVTDPAQAQDVATKNYVDNMVSTQISYHSPVVAATTANLATTTGGTITYTQPNGASNGVGALLTTTGSFNLIDTANVQTLGTRILVKNEGNSVYNGVYTWANATNIVRATDSDEYGPDSANALSINDYFFVSGGNVNAGSAWVLNAPSGTITFGTSNITFAQFSSSQTYTANTSAGISINGTVINAKVDGVTTTFDGSGNISVKASANLTTPNIGEATGTSLSTTGNITSGNLLTGGLISATSTITSAANITGGNILTSGLISATANITGGNLLTAGLISATGTVTGSSLLGSVVSVTANITGGNVLTSGLISATGTITGSSHLGAVVSVTGNVSGGNVLTSGAVSATGNVQGGNLVLTTGNLTFGNVNAATSNSAIQGWSYSNVSLSISASEATSTGIFVGNAGSSFYVVGTTNDRVYQYNMSSTNMANTGVLFGNVSVTTQDATPNDLFIDSTGANLYVLGQTNRVVYQYTLSTPWNITTATYASLSANVAAQETTPTGLWFKPDLTTMYVVGSTNNTVYQYTLATPGNIATATYASKSLSVSAQAGGGGGTQAVNLSSDGTKMWTLASSIPSIAETNLATPWDVSTGTFALGNTYGILAQEGTPTGLFVDLANTRVWMTGQSNDTVYQYNTANSIIFTANAVGIQGQLDVQGNTWFGQQVQFGNTIRAESTLSVDGAFSAGSTFSVTTTTGTISIGTSQTTGTTTIGATAQTGNILIGQSTATQILNIGTGATSSANTKSINIAANGVANSTSNVTVFSGVAGNSNFTIGASTGNTAVTYTANTTVAIANTGGSALSVAGNVTSGNLITTANAIIGTDLYVGNGANATAFTNPVIVGKDTGLTYIQMALVNASGNGSADFTAYSNNGTESAGWVDMGFTGNTFNDTAYTVTGANDGYLFVQGNSSFGGNLVIATGNTGTTKDIVFATGGFLTGNIKARIVDSTGALSVTANVIGGNLTTAGLISSTGNITGGNILTAGILTVTGNIISVANITGGNLLTSGLVSATGNIIGGNISTAGVISATGNITGNYYIGNGSQLTGISATSIANGTSNINIATANGNATVAVNGYSNVAVFGTNSLTLGGPFATPKTINSNVLVANAVNAVLVSPVTIGALGNIFVPDDSTLTIFTPA